VQVLNDYLAKNPEFAKWVNETDSSTSGTASRLFHPPRQHYFPGKKSFKKSFKKS